MEQSFCFFFVPYSDTNYCSNNDVYAENGMPEDLRLICPPYEDGCTSYAVLGLFSYPSIVYCGAHEDNYPYSCTMRQYSNDEWYCSGSCNYPTGFPTTSPTNPPSKMPTISPTQKPSRSPITPGDPTRAPTPSPSHMPSNDPSREPTNMPTGTTSVPSVAPTNNPSVLPTLVPTVPSLVF